MNRKTARVDGIGSIHGGEYESIAVSGIGRIIGPVRSDTVMADGMMKGKGSIDTGHFSVDGFVRLFRTVRAKQVTVNGLLKLRRADLMAEEINCSGLLISNGEVSADRVTIDGCAAVARLTGDEIKITFQNQTKLKGPSWVYPLLSCYFGQPVSTSENRVDSIACTKLTAERLRAKSVHANEVVLGPGCIIDELEVSGEAHIDKSCVIRRFNGKKSVLEDFDMANPNFVRILELYKAGKITADEAEQMTGALHGQASDTGALSLSWPDDRKLRIVAFLGRKLLKKSAENARSIEVAYQGEALDVECYGNLTCGAIRGSASCGDSIRCGDVGGNLSAGDGVDCGNVNGNITAGDSVRCGEVLGNITAGDGVRIVRSKD